MALLLDFLTQIVNVQWEGGLAVEFGNKAQDAPKQAIALTQTPAKR